MAFPPKERQTSRKRQEQGCLVGRASAGAAAVRRQEQRRWVASASDGAAAVRGYGASAGSGGLPPTAERTHPCAACAIPPHYRVFSALPGHGFVPGSAPLRACHRFAVACTRRAGLAPLHENQVPRLRSDRSHDLNAREGRRALGVWRKQARDGLRSLVGARDGGAERCARSPGHGGPVRSQRLRFPAFRLSGFPACLPQWREQAGKCGHPRPGPTTRLFRRHSPCARPG